MLNRRLTALFTILLAACSSFAYADDTVSQLAKMDIEELMRQDVTSAMRKQQSQSDVPSAIYVLTSEEIRRSGATSIVEALRLVPGLTVNRTNSNSWNVTARGFDVKGGTKLLVLIDGRSVYSPFFSGVFWDIQDTFLQDIDRIEVIRGPGAVTWGENAMNGVVNIITKKASETQGWSIVGSGGKEEKTWDGLRYGGKAGEDTAYRVYGKFNDRGQSHVQGDGSAQDGWHALRGGFRADSKISADRNATLQGDIYNEDSSDIESKFTSFTAPFSTVYRNETKSHGGNLLGRYTADFSPTSKLTLQTYYDRTSRRDAISGEARHTFDFDAQHHILLNGDNDLVYGLDYRFSRDNMSEGLQAQWDPPDRWTNLVTTFVQDQIKLSDTFSVIPGTKLGYNDVSGFEYQPALKSIWAPRDNQSFWASVSRAVRIPSRFDEDLEFTTASAQAGPNGVPVLPTIYGSKAFDSEKLYAYELGYREQPIADFSYDLALFYHHYNDLLTLEPGTPFAEEDPVPHLRVPLVVGNGMHGDTYGTELALTWRVDPAVTLAATYSFTELELIHDPGSMDTVGIASERRTPHNQATGRAHFNLPHNFECDALVYYVDSMPGFGVKSYIRTDARIGWNFNENISIDLVGQNLFDPKHSEGGTQIERAYYGRVTYHER